MSTLESARMPSLRDKQVEAEKLELAETKLTKAKKSAPTEPLKVEVRGKKK